MARITINGYASFNDWRDAGYPGAVSFAADGERKLPDPRRGLCSVHGCDNVVGGGSAVHSLKLCDKHGAQWRRGK